ncbi:hypothetical protein H0484_15050 [Pusillimonas sp. CC-YST705]|uniref:Transposase n=1 Tax=Mesopusillimonas faecipullorum TaxID=2755040 RepID=A0ABS8CG74_9BURK|nr:hypothetical protein [Mesopusillimonas faecipullorum]
MPTAVRGQFYRLYIVMDIYSRMIVGWEIHLDERAEHAAALISKACLRPDRPSRGCRCELRCPRGSACTR